MKLFPWLRMPLVFVTLGAMSASGRAEPGAPVVLEDRYYVLQDRQKFVDLRAILDHFGDVYDPDDFEWTITMPPYCCGSLSQVRGTTYRYVPAPGWTGEESFTVSCRRAGELPSSTGTITLEVGCEFVKPFGLGEPRFGIEENWDDYTRPPGYLYEVDLSIGQPIPDNLSAGDVVLLTGQQAEGARWVDITASGACNAPIFIRGAGPQARAKLRQGLHIKGDYVIIEYIDFDASLEDPGDPNNGVWVQVTEQGDGGIIMEEMSSQQGGEEPLAPPIQFCPITDPNDSTHIVVRHCSFLDHPTGAQVTEGQPNGVVGVLFGATNDQSNSPNNATTGTADCVVYDIAVADFGDWSAATATDYYGAGGGVNSVNTWILDSVFHHIQGGGAGFTRNAGLKYQAAARRGFIARNIIHHVREYGIAIKMVHDAIFSQNKIYRIRQALSTNTGGGISIGNNDHCNRYYNESGYHYSDNVWAIFNHIYDVQTGVSINQQVHCGGPEGDGSSECCCPGCCGLEGYPDRCCDETASCCAEGGPDHGPTYEPSRMYVVGNIFDHIQPFGASDVTEKGQAVGVGPQAQVRVVNNTIYKCSQGLQIICVHNSGNPNQCPPYTDPANLTRNTSVTVVNDVMLDAVDPGYYADVHVCSGPPIISEFTLTDGELGFGHNLHYGANRAFRLPNGRNYFRVDDLQGDDLTDYGIGSEGDDTGQVPPDFIDDNPRLVNPAQLRFDLTANSPTFMFTGGVRDAAYDDFQYAFGSFGLLAGIYHDYEGHVYGGTPGMGAFGD